MKYFKYAKGIDSILMYKIHIALQGCKNLAISKYKSNWEDALDDAYFHILEHYDESKGSLMNYAISVVSTIQKNKYIKEIGSDKVFDIESDKYALEDNKLNNQYDNIVFKEEDIEYNNKVRSCIQYLLPFFIKDCELFYNKDSSLRKMNYSELFKKYDIKVINSAINELSPYYDDAKHLNNLSKSCHIRSFDSNRYKNSLDKTLKYVTKINNVVKCKSIGVNRKKYAYNLDIESLLENIYDMFYNIDYMSVACRMIDNIPVYCTLSGKFCFSKDDLFKIVESEIIGSVLALRNNLKVIYYSSGNNIIFTSTKEDESLIYLNMFNKSFNIPLSRLVIGKIIK